MVLLLHRVRNTARTYSGRLGVPFWMAVASVVLFECGTAHWRQSCRGLTRIRPL